MDWILQIAEEKNLSVSRLFIVAWCITDICGKIIFKVERKKKQNYLRKSEISD